METHSAISAMIDRFRRDPPKSREERLSSPETQRLHERFWWARNDSAIFTQSPASSPAKHSAVSTTLQESMTSDASISDIIRQYRRETSGVPSLSASLLRSSTDSGYSSPTSVSSNDHETPEELLARLRRKFRLDDISQTISRSRTEALVARLSTESAMSLPSQVSSLVCDRYNTDEHVAGNVQITVPTGFFLCASPATCSCRYANNGNEPSR